ncbi:MAG: sugar phosphate isomerase/epimerase, partial [Clostridia bacterium]|nr:sugar phosphate isomerase/epimerase [Clostridia bacterium]
AENKTQKDNDYLVKSVRESGLTVSEVLLQHDLVVIDQAQRKANVRLICENIKKVADIGADTVNVFTGPVPWMPDSISVGKQVSAGDAWKWTFQAFDDILPVAEKCGVRVAVENVWGMLVHDFYTNKYLQAKFPSENLGVNLDPSHDVLYGNTDMRFLVNGWGKEKIFHVHVKDAVGVAEPGKFVFPVIGEGNVNFTEFFGALKDTGYNGTASVEFESWAYRNTVWDGKHAPSAPAMRKILDKYL